MKDKIFEEHHPNTFFLGKTKCTVVGKHNKTVNDILTYTKSSGIYEAKMCQALLNELSHLHKSKRYNVFHKKLHVLFGEQLNDDNFLKRIADKLAI